MLNLNDIINLENDKNTVVLNLNNKSVTFGGEKDTFEYFYGCLCGGETDGVLIEESQEILFELSEINIVVRSENRATLSQNGKEYSIDIVDGGEGVSIGGEHYDFNSLIELKNDETTVETIETLVKLNELTGELRFKGEVSALELISKLADNFNVRHELENALDKAV